MSSIPRETTAQELQESLFSDPKYSVFLQSISPDMLAGPSVERIRKDLDAALEGLEKDDETKSLHEAILVRKDFSVLKEKSEKQRQALYDYYMSLAGMSEEKLKTFEDFVDVMTPVRADDKAANYSEFLSPAKTGNICSFGAFDATVRASEYVYASYAAIPHYMVRRGLQNYEIDEDDIADRTQMVMMDIADIDTRHQDHPEEIMRIYLNNMFSYREGKGILALYLACVFDSPGQAQEFIKANGIRPVAPNWDKKWIDPNRGHDEPMPQRTRKMIERMKDINNRFGIEPPLELELRILGSAKIVGPLNEGGQIKREIFKLPLYVRFLEGVQPHMISNRSAGDTRQYMDNALQELNANPKLKDLYETIILNQDFSVLEKKTKSQLKALHALYYEWARHLPFLRRGRRKRLKEFEEFTESMSPIRSDPGNYEEFLSPAKSGNISSFGPQDPIVQAQKYVYASFDTIPHSMAVSFPTKIDEKNIADRSQITMMDIVEIHARASRSFSSSGTLQKYIDNLFSYRLGKKLIAVYLAYIFEDVEEARSFLKDGFVRSEAQNWEELLPNPFKKDQKKYEDMIAKMRYIKDQFGIEPPLALEVRILDSAKIDRSA